MPRHPAMPTSAARITASRVVRPFVFEADQVFALGGVTSDQYVAISDAFPARGRIRATYDRGALELMSISDFHEFVRSQLILLVQFLMVELNVSGNCFGQFTHRRKDVERALEPDACFYLKSWKKIRGVGRPIDLQRDPLLDLAIEIDVSRSSVPRMPLYER